MYNFIQEIFGKAFGCSSTIIEGVSDLVIVPDMDLFAMPYKSWKSKSFLLFFIYNFYTFRPSWLESGRGRAYFHSSYPLLILCTVALPVRVDLSLI